MSSTVGSWQQITSRLVTHGIYASLRGLGYLWWLVGGMPQPVSNDRIIIRFDLKEAIDLDEMAEGFSALSRQYRKMLATRGFSEKEVPTRLLVTRLAAEA